MWFINDISIRKIEKNEGVVLKVCNAVSYTHLKDVKDINEINYEKSLTLISKMLTLL